MNYYRSDTPASPIEALLDRVAISQDSNENITTPDNSDSSNDVTAQPPPTLEQFLEEEDILRECRGDNKRLIAYLCQPDIVRALVSFSVTSSAQTMALRATTSSNTPNGEEKSEETTIMDESTSPTIVDSVDANASTVTDAPIAEDDEATEAVLATSTDSIDSAPQMNPIKYPYVASELLSADIRELCDVVVGDDSVMDLIFACVERNEPGHLDPFVAAHFSKVIVSLLKTRNTQTLKQMKRRGRAFTDSLIKHIALGPISELIVRLLDAPEHERSYDHTIHPPTPGALSLLTGADLLNGLSESFVRASNPSAETENPSQKRHREETLANVTATMTGLTERILQLPPLGVQIPEQLSPYHTPKAITRLLDAGLSAVTSSISPESSGSQGGSPTTVSVPASSVVLSGNYSALLHSLGLAANLMTTKGNIWEEDKPSYDLHNSDSTNDGYGEDGPIEGTDNTLSAFGEEAPQADVSNLLRPKMPGENIISTTQLEQELVIRFERLAQMFGSLETDTSSKLPLGSLRLKLAEFFTACMKKASRATVEHIIELGVPKKLLELFRRYEWSSMLHGVVTSSIISALEAGMSGLPARIAWFQAQIVPWLLSTWSTNEQKEANEECRFRAGYMGHLIKIGAALRIYIVETESMNREALLQLVCEENIDKFKKFSEESLAPAHQIEVTPLCDNDSESEEIYEEDPTDLLEVGVGEVIEGLTQGDPDVAIQRFSKILLYKSGGNIELKDEEEDIQTVDVGDLSHFPDDDVDVQEVNVDIDHDVPPEMRDQLRSSQQPMWATSGLVANDLGASRETNGITSKDETEDNQDDDGTYESHMKSAAASKSSASAQVDKLASDFKDTVRIVEPLSIDDPSVADVVVPIPSPSLEVDAAVTEIDEPQPVTPNVTPLQPRTGVDAEDSSSDEDDLQGWVSFSEFDKQHQKGAAAADPAASLKTKTPSPGKKETTAAVTEVRPAAAVAPAPTATPTTTTTAEPTGNS